MLDALFESDPELAKMLVREAVRQDDHLEMIASENFVSPAVLEAAGSVLTNKYAEGYPGRRYYGGCVHIDEVERLALERAKKVFGCAWANVQPHSGSQANMAVYFALLNPGDWILTQNLAHGGHLTHGSPVNFSGKLYKVFHYGVSPDTGRLDYDFIRKLAREYKPKLILAGWSAYPRQIDFSVFRNIADEAGSYLMVDMAHFAGLVAAKLHPDPLPHAHVVTTTTHKTLRGPRAGMILSNDEEIGKKIDKALFPGMQGGPLCHIVAAKAAALGEALRPEFAEYQKRILENARALAEELIAGGLTLVSGGTDTHLVLVDLSPRGLSGQLLENALDAAGITVNKNAVPFDKRKPMDPSGIRIGTPAVTTRGMGAADMQKIARWILKVVEKPEDNATLRSVRADVRELCMRFPLYPDIIQRYKARV
ncbi:MAG: serine hydroxymethyltransferase [Candidatus Lindowbacteria bacterium RIFCSPLOWO2_12_FULL_62_27]|nr:MAG: serine hydroxymethyltransferase [Candidatus Lindowbacteria bacterium RIFCSPLOWO2_02_FULL_62_12]OGH59299.1 MAG: serine hydroxymethyltransferase [Candidatus Lindowbacteria bacterium RIFCSPLOWO2_12_FULL_62_27]